MLLENENHSIPMSKSAIVKNRNRAYFMIKCESKNRFYCIFKLILSVLFKRKFLLLILLIIMSVVYIYIVVEKRM